MHNSEESQSEIPEGRKILISKRPAKKIPKTLVKNILQSYEDIVVSGQSCAEVFAQCDYSNTKCSFRDMKKISNNFQLGD